MMKTNNKWRRRIIDLWENLLVNLQRRPPSLEQAAVIDKLATLGDRDDSMFEGLGRVKTAESLYYSLAIEISNQDSSVRYTLRECAEDTAFAVYCFMQDATYIRLFSARAWREFALGKIGIQTATFCTNSADAQIGRMSEELRKSFDHFNDTWMTRMHTKVDTFFRRHCGDNLPAPGPYSDQINPECEDDSLARHASRRLGHYVCTMLCVSLTRVLFEAFHSQQEAYIGESMDDLCLLKSLFQLRSFEWLKNSITLPLTTDCTYSGARAILVGHFDTDAIFTAQMLRDAQQQLNTKTLAIEDIIEHLSLDYLDLYRNYASEWNTEKLKAENPSRTQRMCEQYQLLSHTVNGTECVFLQDILERWELETSKQYPVPGFQLLRHVPSLVGQLVAQYRIDFQADFLDIANDRGHILTVIHLYNAAKTSGAQLESWEDLEWIIERQCEHTIFGGERPATNTDYIPQFCLAYGLDAAKFTNHRRLTAVARVQNDIHIKGRAPRRLESCSQLVDMCSSKSKMSEKASAQHGVVKTMEEFAECSLDWSSPYGKPTKIGLLIAGKESYDSDEEALNFDICNFHRKCARLLTSIRDLCLEEAPEDYPAVRFGGDQGINPTVAEIFRDLIDAPRHHERMWPKAVKMLSDLIKEEGSAGLDLAFERMKMTTLESISLDSDSSCTDSDKMLLTPPREQSDKSIGSEDTLSPENTQPAQQGRDEAADAAELRRQSETILSLVFTSVQRSDYGYTQLLSPDGTTVAAWDRTRITPNHERNLTTTLALIRECNEGRMTMHLLDDGNVQFFKDGRLKVLVTMPEIEFQVFDD